MLDRDVKLEIEDSHNNKQTNKTIQLIEIHFLNIPFKYLAKKLVQNDWTKWFYFTKKSIVFGSLSFAAFTGVVVGLLVSFLLLSQGKSLKHFRVQMFL